VLANFARAQEKNSEPKNIGPIVEREQKIGPIVEREQKIGPIVEREQKIGPIVEREGSAKNLQAKEIRNFGNLQKEDFFCSNFPFLCLIR
jgi:hypothetical protein